MHSRVIDMVVRIMFGILFALYIMGNDIRRLITRSRHLSIRISLSINLSNTNSMCLYITRVASLVGRRWHSRSIRSRHMVCIMRKLRAGRSRRIVIRMCMCIRVRVIIILRMCNGIGSGVRVRVINIKS